MHWIDVVLAIWIGLSLYSGWRMGFIYKLGSLIGLGLSIYLASRFAPAIANHFHLNWTWLVTLFFILLGVLSQLFGLVAWLIDKVFHLVYIIPFTKTVNRLLGALLAGLVTVFIIAATAHVLSLISWNEWIVSVLQSSSILRLALIVARACTPFMSDVLRETIISQYLPNV